MENNTIKVLCLNDDNHSNCYVTRVDYYHDCAQFVQKCLLKPHNYTYEVRQIDLVDPPLAFSDMDEDEFMRLFDLLACNYDMDELFKKNPKAWSEREEVFELFWEQGEEWKYA